MAAIEVSGCGVISPVGLGINAFGDAIRNGQSNFSTVEFTSGEMAFEFPAAIIEPFDLRQKIDGLGIPEGIGKKAKRFRNISTGTSYSILCALEAWQNAGLFETDADPDRIAIISGGSNTQLQDTLSLQLKYAEKLKFMNPNHALNLFDTDVNGVLSELLQIRGEGYSVGGASASSNMALVHAHRLLASGAFDIALVIAPLMHLSAHEFQSFTNLGAMAVLSDEFSPQELCRPFDEKHCGFVFGQNTGCIILETPESAKRRNRDNRIAISGGGTSLDANRNPNPSEEGESKAMSAAVQSAGISAEEVAYINTHGTASALGDATEISAIKRSGLKPRWINSTKSLIGHGLTASGLVETIATVIQMEEGFVHVSKNVDEPITESPAIARGEAKEQEVRYALSNGFGFGGINTSILLENLTLTKR